MIRPFVVFVLMLGLNTAAMGTATGRVIDAGRLGSLPVVLPEGEVQEVVFLFSDLTGWHADLDRAADRLSAIGAAVLEVDLPGYLARLGEGDDQDCHYLISEVEGTSKRLQRELGLTHYLSPILAGTGMGSALAYAALAQAPAATVAGAISDGLVTELATRLPLCPGAPSTLIGSGFDYGPKSDLPGWWRVGVRPAAEDRCRAVRRRHRQSRAGRGPRRRRARRTPGGVASGPGWNNGRERVGRGVAVGRATGQWAGGSDGGVLLGRRRLARPRQADQRGSGRAWHRHGRRRQSALLLGGEGTRAGSRRSRDDSPSLSRSLGAPACDPARLLLRRGHSAIRHEPPAR